jgi:hypothetical protein
MSSIDYQEVYDKLKSSNLGNSYSTTPTNLFCISAPKEYLESNIKVMIFGQETNDWNGDFSNEESIEHLLSIYNGFFATGRCFSYGGQFWNGVSKLKSELEEKSKNDGKSVGLLWNNIIKIGRSGDKGLPSQDVMEWQAPAFELIKKEVEFYAPDIVIFFTGPNYDHFISRVFTDASFIKVNERTKRQFAKVVSDALPARTIRTYHPNYLWRNDFYSYLDDIIAEVYS